MPSDLVDAAFNDGTKDELAIKLSSSEMIVIAAAAAMPPPPHIQHKHTNTDR